MEEDSPGPLSGVTEGMNYDLTILSLGAGVQSSVCALASACGDLPPVERAIFADTMGEPESVYQWLDWLETQLPFPVDRVSKGDLAADTTEVRLSKKSGKVYMRSLIPFFTMMPDGKSAIMMRKCTTDYKILPIRRRIRELIEKKGTIRNTRALQHIGISTDEAHRMKDSQCSYIDHYYPLIEAGWSRSDCLAWAAKKELGPPPRSACGYCPYHSDKEWLRIKTKEPEAFQKAIDMEAKMNASFRQVETRRGEGAFLHQSCKPLDQVSFNGENQFDLFGEECEGMCGL